MKQRLALMASLLVLGACGESAKLDVAQTTGPNPVLPAPVKTLFPTVNIAEATGWPAGAKPVAAPGLMVTEFAGALAHPRTLLVLPNGDVLVAETNKPPKQKEKKGGIKEWIAGLIMSSAGAGVPSANRISLLRDADGDGIAEVKTPFLTGLLSPYGMALVESTLYVANADALVAYPYVEGATRIDAPPRRIAALPAGRNHHWTKALAASPDGQRLYVGVGSNSNVAEHGMDEEVDRAAILEIDPATGASKLYAGGLRNPTSLAFLPGSATLYAVVNERDEIGSDLVPDYLTMVRPGAFYGWPWSYWGRTVDTRVEPARPDMVAKSIKPDYALGSHVAPLGLTFAEGARLGPRLASGAFIGLHGSWNRKPRSGYKVVFVPFRSGPTGQPLDILTGFVSEDGKAMGRPVGVQIARDGALLVADDVGNKVWRVSATTP